MSDPIEDEIRRRVTAAMTEVEAHAAHERRGATSGSTHRSVALLVASVVLLLAAVGALVVAVRSGGDAVQIDAPATTAAPTDETADEPEVGSTVAAPATTAPAASPTSAPPPSVDPAPSTSAPAVGVPCDALTTPDLLACDGSWAAAGAVGRTSILHFDGATWSVVVDGPGTDLCRSDLVERGASAEVVGRIGWTCERPADVVYAWEPPIGALSPGDIGPRTMALQRWLVDVGVLASDGADGDFGPGTRRAVIDARLQRSLPLSGSADPELLGLASVGDSLYLRSDGVAPVTFGTPMAEALDVLRSRLGAPITSDAREFPIEGASPGLFVDESDDAFEYRFWASACFGAGLTVHFGGDRSDALSFVGYGQRWSSSCTDARGEPAAALGTGSGLRVGDQVVVGDHEITDVTAFCYTYGRGRVDGVDAGIQVLADDFLLTDADGAWIGQRELRSDDRVEIVAFDVGSRPFFLYDDC